MLRRLLVVAALLAGSIGAAVPAANGLAQQEAWYGGLMPEPGALVPAGTRTLRITFQDRSIEQVSLLLNTEVVPFARTDEGGEVQVTARRSLAPGDYTVQVVARDPEFGIRKVSWQFRAQLTDPVPPDFSQVDARIEIVYPHDGAPVSEAKLANVGAFLFTPGTHIPVPLDFDRPVRLWRAIDSSPAEPVAVGTKVIRTVGDLTFPAWEFNDVDVSAAMDPTRRLFFFLTVDGTGANSNVWVHASDSRTSFARQDVPTGIAPCPDQVDAKVEIVYPHDRAPVGQADLANIGLDIYCRGTRESLDFSGDPLVHLLRSTNSEVASYVGTGERIRFQQDGLEYPRWVFNDVDVSAAKSGTPPNLVVFRAVVDGRTTFSNVWVHGADARTFFPIQDVPSRSAQGARP